MQLVPSVLSTIVSTAAIGAGVAALTSGSRGPAAIPQIQRDDASSVLAANDAVAARKGGAADILNGDAGISQQMPGPKMVLGA